MSATSPGTTRKPRLSQEVRTRIVQLRVSTPERPLSLDKIIVELSRECWDPLPSRGSVQNVVRQWEELPETIRLRCMPFEWDRLEDAELPWESSEWVLKCKREYEIMDQDVRRSSGGIPWGQFSNSHAKWCWRVHIAAPELWPMQTLTIAAGYKYRDELTDLVQHRIPDSDAAQNSVSHSNLMERFLNGLLLYKPWLSDQGRLEFVEQMDNHVLPWPWRSLGWSQYAYGLGAKVPDEYQSHIPPGGSREELAVFPHLFFTSILPTKEVLEGVRQLGGEDSAVESEHRSHSKAALAGTNG